MIIKENKNRMNLEDWALHLIRYKLRKDYGDNFKTSLDVVADNVLSDFLAYIEDEASGFLINEITYDDGLVKGDKLRTAIQDFIDFDLRENDINEYDVDYTIDESLDEAREMHTWSVTYNGKGNKAKTHMVDAPDAYEANRKARRELGIDYSDIDDVTMVENKKMNESAENYNKYRLVDYFDVWGNSEDGYEVNDLDVVADDIVLSDDATDQEILDFLVNMGYLTTNDLDKIEVISWDSDFIEFFEIETGYPIGRLERIY